MPAQDAGGLGRMEYLFSHWPVWNFLDIIGNGWLASKRRRNKILRVVERPLKTSRLKSIAGLKSAEIRITLEIALKEESRPQFAGNRALLESAFE